MFEKVMRNALRHTTFARRGGAVLERDLASSVKLAAAKAPVRRLIPQDALRVSAAATAAEQAVKIRAERAVMVAPTIHNKITYHINPEDSQAALLKSIRTAKSSFYIETFIWHDDEAGNEVIQALADRIKKAKTAGKPFDAKVMIDWFGLQDGTGGKADSLILQKLKDAGVDVKEFSPGYLEDGHLIPITHRKLYIKDGSSYMTGGRNIGNEYLHPTFIDPAGKLETSWHDMLYTVEGDETGRILDQFYKNWTHIGGEIPKMRPKIMPHPTGNARVQSFVTDPLLGVQDLRKAQLGFIANAEKEIYVMYPYFSDDKLIAALRAAKRKNPNLSIRVMLPASREVTAEGGVYTLLNRRTARKLMSDGIEVRMFSGGSVNGVPVDRFSHFKAMMIDGKIVSAGSANGDERTFEDNHELITTISDVVSTRSFRAQVIDPDWASAKPLTQADLQADGWWNRLKEMVLGWFDFIL